MAKKDEKKDKKGQPPAPQEKTEEKESSQSQPGSESGRSSSSQKSPEKEVPTIKVKLPKKILAYGGAFYDSESGTWIRGKGTQKVPRTGFVLSKIANKELIEDE